MANEDYNYYIDLYWDKFDEGFPLMQYNFSKTEVIKKIKECINAGKKITELYPLNDDALY